VNHQTNKDQEWFAVRCVVHHQGHQTYEERITLWHATSFDEAIALADDEARGYARDLDTAEYVGLAQAYLLDDQPDHGAEVFSLMRNSTLPPADYLTAFFDTGSERQQHSEDPQT
jgi:hypothetical protein